MEGVMLTLGNPCVNAGSIPSFNNARAPAVDNTNFCGTSGNVPSTCPLGANNLRRLCCCVVPPGQVANDPHVHTLKGVHYTLLKSGNFLAWSFSKDLVDWHLLAAYSGARLLAVLARLST